MGAETFLNECLGEKQKPERTAREIYDQTNALAREFYELAGYTAPRRYDFRKSADPRAKIYWSMACAAQLALTGTDVEDAISEMEGG